MAFHRTERTDRTDRTDRMDRSDRMDRPDRNGDDAGKKGGAGGRRRSFGRKKVDRFLVDENLAIDYKDPQLLRHFITDRGKIIPRRISGNNAKHQRRVSLAIKRARMLALMPFAVTGK